MNTRTGDLINPTTPRGASSLKGHEAASSRNLASVRTRGPLRLHGVSTIKSEKRRKLHALLRQVRHQVGGLAITVTAHGWGSETTQCFMAALSSLLNTEDAIWLIPDESVSNSPSLQGRRAVVLNTAHEEDLRTYRNLNHDLIFFPALQAAEAEQAARCRHRVRAIVVDSNGPYKDMILKATGDARAVTFTWLGDRGLLERQPQDQTDNLETTQEEPDIAAIGVALKETAKYLEAEYSRRSEFKSIIKKLLEKYPHRPSWNEDLLLEADRNKWPAWAVECLPSLYIPLAMSPDGRQEALVWRYLLACVPERYKYEKEAGLCGDQVYKVQMTAKAARFVDKNARVFEKNRLDNSYPSERSTIGVVITSIIETGIITAEAPISEELKKTVGLIEDREKLKDVVEPLRKLPEEKWKPGILQLAKQDDWSAGTINVLKDYVSTVPAAALV